LIIGNFEKMKTIKVTILMAVLALGLRARADGLYDITFSDAGNLNVGSGQIDIVGGYAVSGYFDVTAGVAAGSFSLYTAGGTGGTWNSLLSSPLGAFQYDNAVYLPTSTNPQFPTDPAAYIDNGGLLFTDVNGDQINLWANGDGSFSFYGDINNSAYDPQAVGVSTITPTPEPSSLALIALMLVPATVFFRHNRKAQLQH
jgi:hypothetical protein